MIRIFFSILVITSECIAGMKGLSSSMHGEKTAVEYQVLNSGKHVLVVKEKIGSSAGKAVFKDRQVVALEIKDSEVLSSQYGFRCIQNGETWVYAVISKLRAKEKGAFHPERAWQVNEASVHLDGVEDVKTVNCTWSPEGESAYPFR